VSHQPEKEAILCPEKASSKYHLLRDLSFLMVNNIQCSPLCGSVEFRPKIPEILEDNFENVKL
jgi:hypothetical protein